MPSEDCEERPNMMRFINEFVWWTQHTTYGSLIPQTHSTPVQQLLWPLSVSDNRRALSTITEVFSVSCFLTVTLSYCSTALSHPLILPLCLCEEACSPAGPGYRDARLQSPRGEGFLNPSCPPGLMQCISLLLGFFVRHSRRSITSHPSDDNLWASCPL